MSDHDEDIQTDDDLETIEEEGAVDLSETVKTRPVMPEHEPILELGAASSAELTSEAESIFRASELFQGLTREEVVEVVNASKPITLKAGEPLFEQGDEADALYIVESGELQVRATSDIGEDIVLAVLGTGTAVGEMSLIAGGPRSATVEALSDCHLYLLSRSAFEDLRAQKRPAAYKIILRLARLMGERRRAADHRIEQVFSDPARHLDDFESQVHDMLARIKKA